MFEQHRWEIPDNHLALISGDLHNKHLAQVNTDVMLKHMIKKTDVATVLGYVQMFPGCQYKKEQKEQLLHSIEMAMSRLVAVFKEGQYEECKVDKYDVTSLNRSFEGHSNYLEDFVRNAVDSVERVNISPYAGTSILDYLHDGNPKRLQQIYVFYHTFDELYDNPHTDVYHLNEEIKKILMMGHL